MTAHHPLTRDIGTHGRSVVLNSKPIAECVNEQVAAWVASALVLQSTPWAAVEQRSRDLRYIIAGVLFVGAVGGFCAALWWQVF